MENGIILIFKNLETVYSAMYDLFNQNFTIINNKSYARLAIGSNISTFAYVNNKFRCIINVDEKEIDNEEPPFLNRFEKHILSFEYLLTKELVRESENIKSVLDYLVVFDKKAYKGINYSLKELLINCNKDEIQALIYQANKNGKKEEKIIDEILKIISLTLPQDILVNMRINGFKQKYLEYYDKIIDFYGKGEHSSFSKFLKKANNFKNVIYTFSNNLEKINNIVNIKNDLLGEINNENIKIININSINSENELERILDNFLNEENQKICLIKFMPNEGDSMDYLKYFI